MTKSGKRGGATSQISTVHPDAAGIDVGATQHVVAVGSTRDESPVRTFRTFSADLHSMADWLTEVGIKTRRDGSRRACTGIPVFEILEARGFEVLLVNARDAKNVPGRKTDVNDAPSGCSSCTPAWSVARQLSSA